MTETFPGGRSLSSVFFVPCSLPRSPRVCRPGLAQTQVSQNLILSNFSLLISSFRFIKDFCLCNLKHKNTSCRVSKRRPLQRGSLTEVMGEDGGMVGRRIDAQDLHQPQDPLAPLLVGLQQPLVICFTVYIFNMLHLYICLGPNLLNMLDRQECK